MSSRTYLVDLADLHRERARERATRTERAGVAARWGIHPPTFWWLVLFCTAAPSAHEMSRSESVLSITDASVMVRFSINLLEFRGVDANGDERVSYDELDARIEDVFAAIREHFVLAASDRPARVVLQRQQIVEDHVLQADLLYTFDRPVRRLRVASTLDAVTTPGHVHAVRTSINGESFQALLTPQSRTADFLAGGITIGRIVIVLLAFIAVAAVTTLRMVARRRAE